jgi:hypothetical protein
VTPSEYRDFHTGNLTIGALTVLFGGGLAAYLVSEGWPPGAYYVVPAVVFVLIGMHVNSCRGAGSKEHSSIFLLWALVWPIVAAGMLVTSAKELEK